MKYVLFKNIYFKSLDRNFFALYNPLKDHKIIFLKKELFDALSKFEKPLEIENFPKLNKYKKRLLKHRFLLSEHFDQNKPIRTLADKVTIKPKISLMYIILTEQCNFRCDYCFFEGNLPKNKIFEVMSNETCDNAIDYFAKTVDKEANSHKVIFYGGEPFLNRTVFQRAVKKLRALENQNEFSKLTLIVNTNASQINNRLARFCKEYSVNLAISLDGPKAIHDAIRKDIIGRGTFEGTLRAYKLLQRYGIRPGISCTITRQNVDLLEEVAEFFAKLNPSGVGFNFLLDFKDGKNPCTTSIEKSTEGLLKAFKVLRQKGIYEERIMRRLNKIINNEIHAKDCAGYGNQIVIGPSGSIGPCQVFLSFGKYKVGNVNEEFVDIKKDAIFSEWAKRIPFNMEGCIDCSFISLCGGGCAYQAYITEGSIWEKDERVCKHCKYLMDWVIDDLWERKKKQI